MKLCKSEIAEHEIAYVGKCLYCVNKQNTNEQTYQTSSSYIVSALGMQEVAFLVPPPCFKWMTRIPHVHMPAMSQLPQEQCTNMCVCVHM